jgi:paraquat-inducible protein B
MPQNDTDRQGAVPKARIKRRGRFSPVWIAPLVAAGFAGWLFYRDVIATGPSITISFKNAENVEVGKTALRFRGVKIGEVSDVQLSRDLRRVQVKVDLKRSASEVAHQGSEFWIVHPVVAAGEIRGLGTIVSGDYIEVKPGTGSATKEFTGLDEPPALNAEQVGGLDLVLISTEASSAKSGSPVLFRGMHVGQVVKQQLGPDSQEVRTSVHVDAPFTNLVRLNSKFWNAGGVNVNLGLFGAQISAQSFKTLVSGGIAFATPDQMEAPARNGTVFRLYEKPEKSWAEWAPAIKLPKTATEAHTEPKEKL